MVSVTCKNEDGDVIGGSENVAVLEIGEKKEIKVPAIDEYEFAGESAFVAEGTGEPITVEYI